MLQSVTFEGRISGDGQSFCWDVTKKEFIKVMKREPYSNEKSNKTTYRIYPCALFYALDIDTMTKQRFAIFVEPPKEKNL